MWHRLSKRPKQVAKGNESAKAAGLTTPAEGEVEVVADSREPAALAPDGARPASGGALRLGLVVTGSALCGGIAVVLWNRRLLTKMREVAQVPRLEPAEQQRRLWEDDF